MKIEKNIPLSSSKDRISWPWKDMDIGDSVLFEDDAIASKAQTNCHVYGHQSGKKFASRKVDGGVRIWRIA